MPALAEETARELFGVVPLVMRTVRAEMRRHRTLDLSVPQFRSLGFVHRHTGTSLSDVAEHIGLALPSMSRLIDGLVERKLMMRHNHLGDRRRITLELTPCGQALWQSAHDFTQASLADRVSALSRREHATVVRALRMLHRLFNSFDNGSTLKHQSSKTGGL